MSVSFQKSEKLNIINQKAHEDIQNQEKRVVTERKIHNTKYKKNNKTGGNAATFDLLQFLRPARGCQKAQKKLRRHGLRRVLTSSAVTKSFKKRGKTREGGKRKRFSRLKKSILVYRLLKRQQEHSKTEALLNQIEENLSLLAIEGTSVEEKGQPITDKEQVPMKSIHSRRFREYCDHYTTSQVCQLTDELLRELNRFQRRAYAQNEIKARAHRRFVVGFREMKNYLRIKKVKLAIIAPDCETCEGEEGLNETIEDIKSQCVQQQVPYCFSLRRRQLAYTLYKKVPLSCVAILDYDGAREIFTKLLAALHEARQAYKTGEYESLQPFARKVVTSLENGMPAIP